MLRRLFGEGKVNAKDLAGYFMIAAALYFVVAITLLSLGDEDGGTGPNPQTSPQTPAPPATSPVPDRPPAEWFAKC